MPKRILTDRWMHPGQKRAAQQRLRPEITIFRDSSRGQVGFHACFVMMTVGKRREQHGPTYFERRMAFKLGQHRCGGLKSNPRAAVAAALRATADDIDRRSIRGGFAGRR